MNEIKFHINELETCIIKEDKIVLYYHYFDYKVAFVPDINLSKCKIISLKNCIIPKKYLELFNLNILYLKNCFIEDEFIKPEIEYSFPIFNNFPIGLYNNINLSIISISKCKVSDSFLKCLCNFNSLTELKFSHNEIVLDPYSIEKLIDKIKHNDKSISLSFKDIKDSDIFDLPDISSKNRGVKHILFNKIIETILKLIDEPLFWNTIPEEIGDLKYLIKLDLSGNNFTGEIPYSFKYLRKLKFLKLSENNLSGDVRFRISFLLNTLDIFKY